MSAVLDRDAPYYPDIHIRDVNWLKATLFCFPQVRRMIPLNFELNDIHDVQAFRSLTGPRNELLIAEEDTIQVFVDEDLQRLLKYLISHEYEIFSNYSRKDTGVQYGIDYDSFQIHVGKILKPLRSYVKTS